MNDLPSSNFSHYYSHGSCVSRSVPIVETDHVPSATGRGLLVPSTSSTVRLSFPWDFELWYWYSQQRGRALFSLNRCGSLPLASGPRNPGEAVTHRRTELPNYCLVSSSLYSLTLCPVSRPMGTRNPGLKISAHRAGRAGRQATRFCSVISFRDRKHSTG